MGSDLLQRLDRLESIEAIRSLKHTYCKLCDAGYDAQGLSDLFWEEATWEAEPGFGRFEGAAAIRGFFEKISGSILWARHLVTNERIQVDGDCASGEFDIIQPCTFKSTEGGQAAWLMGRYFETYRRRGGVWKYLSLRAEIDFISPYEQGWHRARTLEG